MTKRIMLWDASQDWMTSLDVYVLIHKNKRVVLLTSKFSVRLGERIWRFPPQDVMYWNSSSRLDSRGFKSFSKCLVCQLGYLNTYSNYRLHLLFTVRPQIILTQCPHGLPSQEGTRQGSFWVTTIGCQSASSWLHITFLRMIKCGILMPQGTSSWENEDQDYPCSHFLRVWAAMTKAGAAKYRTLPDQLWVRFCGRPYPYLFFPTLPPSETYLQTFLRVIRAIQCFEKTCHCWNKVDWRQCSGESCISHQSLTSLVPYDQADHALRCLSRLDDFSGRLCSYPQE